MKINNIIKCIIAFRLQQWVCYLMTLCDYKVMCRRWWMNEWVWSIGGKILTGETEVFGEKHHIASVVVEWMSMEHWWNDTDSGNWSTGRKTLYSVGGRWMNEYGALVEWYWQRETEVLGKKYYIKSVVDEWMIMEHYTDRVKPNYSRKNPVPLRYTNLSWTGRGSTSCLRG